VEIEVWSDVICPWCYIGRRRLEAALRGFDIAVTVTFRAFQLDPTPVPRPLPIKAAMAAKFGGPGRAEQMFAHVAAIAAGEGLRLDFNSAIAANTFDAHRLVAWAAAQGRQADMVDALQRGHFSEGVDLGSHTELAAVAGSIGLHASAALAYLGSGAGTELVETDLNLAYELGITSVPTFVIDRRYAVQGAQEAAVLRQALEEIARREAVEAGR
jgi:predicted DsbA family dithiol-disulfide isomerase